MKYLYTYQTIVHFSCTVNTHFIKLRCLPCMNHCQHIIEEKFIIYPSIKFNSSNDSFGNRIMYGGSTSPHDSLAYISSGIVELDEYRIPDTNASPMYLAPTSKTQLSDEMKDLCNRIVPPHITCGDTMQQAQQLCQLVYENMTYQAAATNMNTTAAEAFTSRKGVCQDYAHILIALCRGAGIKARYANGFIAGEGETHAWVEVHDGNEWKALDPTHGWNIINQGYIKIAHGRDADDCPVSRGTYMGMALQQTDIRVIVNAL